MAKISATSAPAPDLIGPPTREQAHAAYIAELLKDPAFKPAPKSGASYIIPGLRPFRPAKPAS